MPDSRTAWIAGSGLLLSALVILWIGNATNIDIVLADAAFDKVTHSFPMQHAWLAEKFNHVILKKMLSALAAYFVVLALWDAVRPFRRWSDSRRMGGRVVAMSAVLVPLVISLMKHVSASHCPWDLERYGGTAPYIRLLEWMPAHVSPGHCMPGGHASSALWLISIAAFWWPDSRRKGIAVGALMLLAGGAVGWIQQLRGAHFLTHTLWSAWIACALVMAIYSVAQKGLARLPGAGYNSVPAATQT
jgi:membrane-associated PAP2 superfamily phosphatase